MIKGTYGKTHGSYSSTFGGGFTVWDNSTEQLKRYQYGGVFTDILSEGDIVPSGTPVKYDRENKKVTICKAFKVNADTSAGYTTVQILKGTNGDLWRVSAGDILMKCPDSKTGTGTGVAIDSVDTTNEVYDVVTVDADAFGALSEDDILVYADAEGASASQSVVPTDLIEDNIYVGTGDSNSDSNHPINCAVVWAGSLMKLRMPPYPPYLEENTNQRYVFNPE